MKRLFLNVLSLSLAIFLFAPALQAQDKDKITDLINSIPSPVELSALIKSQDIAYKKALLNDAKKSSNYTTSHDQAFNLGVYATDLGFASLYGRTVDALDYLGAVKKLATELSIDQFLDEETIRDAANASNVEQLLLTSTQSLEDVNMQLQRENRNHLSLLFVAGSWLEGLHLATQTYKEGGNDELKTRIGEQKLALGQIMTAMKEYESKPGFSTLMRDFKQLERAFASIKVVQTTDGGPTSKVVDGEVVISGGPKTVVTASKSDILSITSLVEALRKKHVR
ncbi:MAG: hypothetical protein AAF740_01965 [Bacteroidota bacterium]